MLSRSTPINSRLDVVELDFSWARVAIDKQLESDGSVNDDPVPGATSCRVSFDLCSDFHEFREYEADVVWNDRLA